MPPGWAARLRRITLPLFYFLATLAAGVAVFLWVDLTPEIDTNFFFSSDDPHVGELQKIDELFAPTHFIVMVAQGDIYSREHRRLVPALTDELAQVRGVTEVVSLARGPLSITHARESPLWSRLLLTDDLQASLVFAFVVEEPAEIDIEAIKRIRAKYETPANPIAMSGVAYVIHEIQNHLISEMRVFTVIAFVMFSILIYLIFGSGWILAGSLTSCAAACFLDFILMDLLRIEPGILMTNLWSIVFVLTLSHTIYLTGNWESGHDVGVAVKRTRRASFWSMFTTLAGFLTLLTASAKPIQQFGLAGALGALISIVSAYTIFPAFLRLSPPMTASPLAFGRRIGHRVRELVLQRPRWAPAVATAIFVLTLPGSFFVDTGPPLFSYFEKESRIRRDLEAIDRMGGSSPFDIAVRYPDGHALVGDQAYIDLWNLQFALEDHEETGSILSLPVILSEGVASPVAPLVSWKTLVSILESPILQGIGQQFITADRTHGRFLIRMRETGLERPRTEIAREIEETVRRQGFEPAYSGGLFPLQGVMAELVSSSLYQGILGLLAFFFAVALWLSRSVRTALAMISCLAVIPAATLGLATYLEVSLDLISAPAISIAIAVGVDDMIHLLHGGRTWDEALRKLWKPVVATTVILAAGFGAFQVSSFPSTRQLGTLVAAGSLIALIMTLFILPRLLVSRVKAREAVGMDFALASGMSLSGFKTFLSRGNVIDLAVAVVIGAAFGAVVASFVADLLTPLIAAIIGQPDFSDLSFTINGSRFMYGRFLNTLLSFLIVSAAIYFFAIAPLAAWNRRKAATPANTRACPECLSEIPIAARRCAHCSAQVTPVISLTQTGS